METKTYIIKTRSGLHCGIGQGLSDIDLPTAKESVSGYPFIPATSLKGVLRDHFNDQSDIFTTAFGQASSDRIDFAAALSFTDARLICLPVRAYFGTFAYLTSPYALNLLKTTLHDNGATDLPVIPDYPAMTETDCYRASLPEDSDLRNIGDLADQLLLEDLDLLVDNGNSQSSQNSESSQSTQDSKNSQSAQEWADLIAHLLCGDDEEGQQLFKKHFAIADDNVLAFLCETALPVATHTRIGENGVVVDGALWFEEFVPPEAIFMGTIYAEDSRNSKHLNLNATQIIDFVSNRPINCQVGGNATTGRGLISITFNQPQGEKL
ncbi:MAG: type III-B CRISPR module RAMP protein Cmr4 [Desulfamplus sp.]|nr:type III-B CRISPR module RAMP protein Cmr4 [Desulfamplus sp.]